MNRLRASCIVAFSFALAACGNKGPLVHPAPPVAPLDEAAAQPIEDTLPDTTPPEQVPATEALDPPAQDPADDAIPPPPPAPDTDGG